jgi:L-ascorbate metabolism protein UlaG (beta-lactamase superfamily)
MLDRLMAGIPHDEKDRDALRLELRALFDELIKTKALWLRLADAPGADLPGREDSGAPSAAALRLRRAVQMQMVYRDDTAFGSPLGGKLERNVRQLFAPLLRRARAHGPCAAIADGPELLAACIASPAFRDIAESVSREEWVIKPDVLYPDPARTVPVGVAFTSSETGVAITVGLEPADAPTLRDVLCGLESPAGIEPGATPGWAGRIAQLAAKGLLEPAGVEAGDAAMEACDLVFVGHNTVVVNAGAARIIVDPFFLPPTRSSDGYAPLRPSDLGRIDAVLITHSHPDHFDLTSLMRLGGDTVIVVPEVPRESILAIDMKRRLTELGFTRVISLSWGELHDVGNVRISVLPFHGEQPSSGAILHPEVRNQGALYVIRGPRLTAALVADAGTDSLGSVAETARAWRRANGTVDVLFAGYRGWFTYPAQLLFSSVPQYLLFVPPSEWGTRQKLMNDATDAVDLAETLGATTLVPYGAGGAPWYWERGLGPRLDGAGDEAADRANDEDVSFDPMPDRVDEAVRQRLWIPGHGWLGSRTRVLHMRPGDGIVDVRGEARIVTRPGCAWPWKRPQPSVASRDSVGLRTA